MFVSYIDGDNMSFKDVFRNLNRPLVFTSVWTCLRFMIKVAGPICLGTGLALVAAMLIAAKMSVLESAVFMFIPFICVMLIFFPFFCYGGVVTPRWRVKQMRKAIQAMTGGTPELRKSGPMKYVFEFDGMEYFAKALCVPPKAEYMAIGQLFFPLDDDFPHPFVKKDGIMMQNDDFFDEWCGFLSGKPAAEYIRYSYNSISFIADFKEKVSASDYAYAFGLMKYLPGRFHLMPVSCTQYEEILNKALTESDNGLSTSSEVSEDCK